MASTPRGIPTTQPLDSHCQPCGSSISLVYGPSRPTASSGMYALSPADALSPIPVNASSTPTSMAPRRQPRPSAAAPYPPAATGSLSVLPEAARRHLEAMMATRTYEYQSDF